MAKKTVRLDGIEYGDAVGPAGSAVPVRVAYRGDLYEYPSLADEAVLAQLVDRAEPLVLAETDEVRDAVLSGSGVQPAEAIRPAGIVPCALIIDDAAVADRPLLDAYPRLVAWGLRVLQDRSFTVDERVWLLAHLCAAVQHCEVKGHLDALDVAVTCFLDPKGLRRMVDQYNAQPSEPRALAVALAKVALSLPAGSAARGMTEDALVGIGAQSEEDAARNAATVDITWLMGDRSDGWETLGLKALDAATCEACRQARAELFDRYQLLLEHVAVCSFLAQAVPLSGEEAWASLRLFMYGYALQKAVLMTRPGLDGETPEAAAELVRTLAVLQREAIPALAADADLLRRTAAVGLDDVKSLVTMVRG